MGLEVGQEMAPPSCRGVPARSVVSECVHGAVRLVYMPTPVSVSYYKTFRCKRCSGRPTKIIGKQLRGNF